MTLILDLMHLIAATLLAVVGLGYEREEECAPPVHFQPAAHVVTVEAEATVTDASFTQTRWSADCEAEAVVISYPVL
jgi:hypothetical protein